PRPGQQREDYGHGEPQDGPPPERRAGRNGYPPAKPCNAQFGLASLYLRRVDTSTITVEATKLQWSGAVGLRVSRTFRPCGGALRRDRSSVPTPTPLARPSDPPKTPGFLPISAAGIRVQPRGRGPTRSLR